MRLVVAGRFYNIRGIKLCVCGAVCLDVGVPFPSGYNSQHCCMCEKDQGRDVNVWIDDKLFAPLSEISEVHEALKEEPFKICG